MSGIVMVIISVVLLVVSFGGTLLGAGVLGSPVPELYTDANRRVAKFAYWLGIASGVLALAIMLMVWMRIIGGN